MLVWVIVWGLLAILLVAVVIRIDMRARRRGRQVNIDEGKIRSRYEQPPTDTGLGGL
jgi:hypothetical protein